MPKQYIQYDWRKFQEIFGFLFLLLAVVLALAQVIEFPFYNLSGGRLTLVCVLTVSSVIFSSVLFAEIGSRRSLLLRAVIKPRRVAGGIACGMSILLIAIMAVHLLRYVGMDVEEYIVLVIYLIAFTSYGIPKVLETSYED